MKLSILICTIPKRKEMFNELLRGLNSQAFSSFLPRLDSAKEIHVNKFITKINYADDIEIITDSTIDISVGQKRNHLLKAASGEFIVFIDDDDVVMPYYIRKIVATIDLHPDIDCIGMQGIITFNGENEKKWFISKDFGSWYEENNIYYRTPNHISPVRRSIALQIGFPDISFGEDYEYSKGILPLLKKEAKIETDLYHYKFVENKNL